MSRGTKEGVYIEMRLAMGGCKPHGSFQNMDGALNLGICSESQGAI